jgi:hypothetical protein
MTDLKKEENEKAWRFKKGVSPNPLGRPKKITVTKRFLEQMTAQAGDIVGVLYNRAVEGDTAAIKIIVDRLCPAPKKGYICLSLPKVKTPDDLLECTNIVMSKLGEGEISGDEAEYLTRILESQAKALEMSQVVPQMDELKRQFEEIRAFQQRPQE